ncbi:SPBC16G5.07c Uncharacterized protein C16G5.07c [Candida maltosa Xu316]|uniref:Band 7 domain-containing protein n=1 Tax=Candida maltosa (strain Xu316) TaxID=1245528 RepID=M3J512_CANMX|nr:hypothetical protein G210_2624 [Candida maltosa Xu316]
MFARSSLTLRQIQTRYIQRQLSTKPVPQFFQGVSSLPSNKIINFIPQEQQWVIERMGKFNRIAKEGPHFIYPLVEKIRQIHSLKESVLEIPPHNCITSEQDDITIDGVAWLKTTDPYKATYNIDDANFAIGELAQTTMRTEIGNLKFADVIQGRKALNEKIRDVINEAASNWGVECIRYEIKDISKI